ncbi:ABC transporter ATP-binding protein [Peribacillus sp. SCS-37]|uniref:ABC transporter ATP-binding protein n=1 Tax=Paraperibacillus esterisolvens TaxID=3115296 RepID=UPI0039061DBC
MDTNSLSVSGKEQRKILSRLLRYAKPHKKVILIAFFCLLMMTLGNIFGPIIIGIFIDDYLRPGRLDRSAIITLGSLYMGIQVAMVIFMYFQLLKFQEIALAIIKQLRIDIFSKVHTLGMKYFDRTPGGSLVSRVTNDTEAIKDMFVSVVSTFIQSAFQLTGIFIAMFVLNVKLALLCAIILPIIFLVMAAYRQYSSVYYQDMRERLSQLNAKISESLQGMAIIQVFRQERRLRREFEDINEKHYSAGMKNIKVDGLLLRPALDLIYALTLIIVLSFFGITSLKSPVEIGVIYVFVSYIDRFFEPLNQVMMRLSLFQQAIIAGERVFKVIDEKELSPGQTGSGEHSISNGEIQFRNVSFSYDGKRDVLKNISFTAKKGETVALVGHTGSGKSSIINLMMRFYEYDRGDILVDGVSLKEYSQEELRSRMGLVLQDPFLFFGTIKDNIRLYDPSITDEDIVEAARFVQAHGFISRLPERFDHQVVERGSTFSSGQKQLIAFARTIAANPKILILDEATANIDTETEEAIQVALGRMRQGRTTIAIAHRLSTIQDADQILVLHQGEIVERGTHQELLAKRKLYYKMYLLQNGLSDKMENAL